MSTRTDADRRRSRGTWDEVEQQVRAIERLPYPDGLVPDVYIDRREMVANFLRIKNAYDGAQNMLRDGHRLAPEYFEYLGEMEVVAENALAAHWDQIKYMQETIARIEAKKEQP